MSGRPTAMTGSEWGRTALCAAVMLACLLTMPLAGQESAGGSSLSGSAEQGEWTVGDRIGFTLAKDSRVRVELYDLKGRKVDTLIDEAMPAGVHRFTYQPEGLASGAYVILMRAGSFRASQRMMLVK